MLIEFTVRNYKSISHEQKLSLVASHGGELTKNLIELDNLKSVKLVRSAAIYGANAAGKSNILKAIHVMENMVLRSAEKNFSKLPIVNFKLDVSFRDQPSEFEVDIICENVRYQYGFSANEHQIFDEWLYAFPHGKSQKWFLRTWDEKEKKFDWDFGSKLLGEKQTWLNSTRNNALFLSTAVQLNSQQLKPIHDWFRTKLHIDGAISSWTPEFTIKFFEDNEENKNEVLRFLQAADIGIDGIDVEKKKLTSEMLPNDIPDSLKNLILDQIQNGDRDSYSYKINILHKNLQNKIVKLNIDEESDGTNKLFSYAGPLIDSLREGNVLFIDELNSNLHPKLLDYVVSLFNNPSVNKNNAQLIFTTHETSILNQKCLRRDQVWFVEKDNEKASKLFPLTDFSPRKGRENIEESYLSGRYGALPMVKMLNIFWND